MPFRVFKSWFLVNDFDVVVENSWKEMVTLDGVDPFTNFKNKLKALKGVLKCWNKNVREKERGEKRDLETTIEKIELKMERGVASIVKKQERLNLINKLEEIENRESLDLAQKASINWDIEWDENSKFFHGSLKQKRRQQSVQGIMIDGMWHTESGVVKNEFLSYFKEKFAKFNPTLPSLGNHRFAKLNETEREELQNEVSREEIKTAVWSCGSDKAPGPDGFSFRFIKKYWAILESDIVKYVQEFF